MYGKICPTSEMYGKICPINRHHKQHSINNQNKQEAFSYQLNSKYQSVVTASRNNSITVEPVFYFWNIWPMQYGERDIKGPCSSYDIIRQHNCNKMLNNQQPLEQPGAVVCTAIPSFMNLIRNRFMQSFRLLACPGEYTSTAFSNQSLLWLLTLWIHCLSLSLFSKEAILEQWFYQSCCCINNFA